MIDQIQRLANHKLGDALVLIAPNKILRQLGIEEEKLYLVAAKAGMAVRLKLPSDELTDWIVDRAALAALRPFFGNSNNGHKPPPPPDRSSVREEMWRRILRNQPGGGL